MCGDDKADMKLREFLLSLLDDMSDFDRCRLHFVLGNEVPRRLRQFSNMENTIQVFEHLIDSGKIFNCLIDALSACGKPDWSKKLKGMFSSFLHFKL
jgi:hypothetical protein